MNVNYTEVLIQNRFEPFFKRVWQTYSANFLIMFAVSVIPCMFFKEINAISILWIVIVVAMLFSGLYNSYKWSLNQISTIVRMDNVFIITIVTKNSERDCQIAESDISAKLRWQSGKLKVLKLTILNQKNKIIDVYSARKKDEYNLENIVHQINRKIKA